MKKIYAVICAAMIVGSTSLKAADWYLSPFAFAIDDPFDWNSAPDGVSGSAPVDFSTPGDIWHFTNKSGHDVQFELFNLPSASTASIHSNFHLTVSNGFITGNFKLDIANGGTLTISNSGSSYDFNLLGATSNVVFNSSGYPVRHSSAHKTLIIYGNIRIAKNINVQGRLNNISCRGLTIDAGVTFSVNANNLTINSSNQVLSGSGLLYADTARITLQGGNGGNNGTLNLHPSGNRMNLLRVAFTSTNDFVSLGNDVNIITNPNGSSGTATGLFLLQSGRIDLNGHSLTTDVTSDLTISGTNARIEGDVNSSIIINGTTGSVGGGRTLRMHSNNNNLAALVLNNPAATMTVGTALIINDSLSVLDGTLDANGLVTLNINGTTKARISRIGGAVNNNVIIPTFISGGATGWMFMGAPVGGQTVSDWDTHVSSSGANGIPMTCTGCSFPPTAYNPPFTSIQAWDEANDTYVNLSSTTSLPLGQGFWVYVGDGTSTTGDLSVIGTGPVAQGLTPIALSSSGSSSDHWNLVANPMPSPISWSKTHARTEGSFPGTVGAEIHIFSPDLGYGSYVAGSPSGVNGVTDILPIGQGFYVTTPGGGNLLFDENCKMDDQSTELYRTSGSVSASNAEYFKLKISGAYGNDEAMFNFNKMATKNFDRLYDAGKIFVSAGYSGYGNSYSKYTTLSSKDASGTDYSINSMPPLTSSVSIPLLARVMASGTHTISVSEKVNFGSCLVLYDKVLNKYHDLNASAYVFEISDTTSTPRFELTLCQTESEPVLSVEELNSKSNILIGQDRSGAFVRTTFEQPTKATISVFNIVGQQLLKDIQVEGTETMTQLPLNVSNQVVIIRVTTDSETQVKKFIAH